MKAANVYLNFAGNAEEAFNFYREVLGGEFAGGVIRFRQFPGMADDLPPADRQKVAHVALSFGNSLLMGSDTLESLGHTLTPGNNYFISLDVDSAGEAEKIFSALSEGGSIAMPLDRTEWAEKYGICTDRFGIQWMVGYTGEVSFG
jgi:PhnB protein